MSVLGKVTGDLHAPRGPDVSMTISVGRACFGGPVEVRLPRTLPCAACQGGGCDVCEKTGAITLRLGDEAPGVITVGLPALLSPERKLCLRIPSEGGYARAEDLGRGHLMLTICPSEDSSSEVTALGPAVSLDRAAEREFLMKRSLKVAAFLILVFVGLLRLSGWI